MQCPVCNHLNTAITVRCVQCSTTLIPEAAGHSPSYAKAANEMDGRVYSAVGAFFGFFISAALLKFVLDSPWLTDRQVHLVSIAGAVAGGLLGRLFLRAKQSDW